MELNNKNLTIEQTTVVNVNDFLNSDSDFRELIGTRNGVYYCTELSQYADSNPREWSNLWWFIGLNSSGFDCDVDYIQDFDTAIYKKFGVYLDLYNLYEDSYKDTYFYYQLEKRANKNGLIIEPINEFEHSETRFFSDEICEFNSGLRGLAIVSKSKLRDEYNHKLVTKKDLIKANEALDSELEIFTDAYNGYIYNIVAYDTQLNLIDSLGGVYDSEISYMQRNNTLLDYMIESLGY